MGIFRFSTLGAVCLGCCLSPVIAGDNASMAQLAPEEWKQTIFETTCQELQDCCGIHRDCGSGWDKPISIPVAPVPLPGAGLMILLGLAGLAMARLQRVWQGDDE